MEEAGCFLSMPCNIRLLHFSASVICNILLLLFIYHPRAGLYSQGWRCREPNSHGVFLLIVKVGIFSNGLEAKRGPQEAARDVKEVYGEVFLLRVTDDDTRV